VKFLRAKAVEKDMESNLNLDSMYVAHGKRLENKRLSQYSVKGAFSRHFKLGSLKNPFKSFRGSNTPNLSRRWDHHSFTARHPLHTVVQTVPTFSVEKTGSHILEAAEIIEIWRWLPTRLQLLEFEIVYSTDIHGSRLMTLFDKIEFYHTTVIVVKTLNGDVFGAFCSQPWFNRMPGKALRPSYFGTGESFLFKLRPKIEKYEWIGKSKGGETQCDEELFQFADNKTLIVGSGGHGSGLQIDENIQFGSSSRCNTFQNEQLCDEQHFEIGILEVMSFMA